LCGAAAPSTRGTHDNQEPRRRRGPLILTAEGTARERDPDYLAQMRARKAVLQAQAVLLRAQESYPEVVGAAD
jgi:hypothetical protein